MSSTSGKEQFMKQFDTIVEGIKQNKVKVSTSKNKIKYLWILVLVENYTTRNRYLPHQWCLHLDVVVGFACSNEPES
jgi:hypothetical protein